MSALNLFSLCVPQDRVHPVFAMLLQDQYEPERAVLHGWANGFVDRDGKFAQEFQTTFESGLWELYVHACLRELGLQIDMTHNAPDFVVVAPVAMSVEATIAAPPSGGKPAYGRGAPKIPLDIGEFNRGATLRICNSFDAKSDKYQRSYANLPHVSNNPYVIAIGAYDRPFAQMAASRPILAALYGIYHDEEATIARRASHVVTYDVSAVRKSELVDIPVGLFCSDEYAHVSAVLYSSLATWGKVRALANNPGATTVYTTFHPNPEGLVPEVRRSSKAEYREHLLDGLYVLHNPSAKNPVPAHVLSHDRVAQVRGAGPGELIMDAPGDFLLMRTLMSTKVRTPAPPRSE